MAIDVSITLVPVGAIAAVPTTWAFGPQQKITAGAIATVAAIPAMVMGTTIKVGSSISLGAVAATAVIPAPATVHGGTGVSPAPIAGVVAVPLPTTFTKVQKSPATVSCVSAVFTLVATSNASGGVIRIVPGAIHTGIARCSGWSIRETAGAAAVVTLREPPHGPILAVIGLPANDSETVSVKSPFFSKDGIMVEVNSGAIEGVLYAGHGN